MCITGLLKQYVSFSKMSHVSLNKDTDFHNTGNMAYLFEVILIMNIGNNI